MEDETIIETEFSLDNNDDCRLLTNPLSFFAVLDGHGGRAAAIYTRDHLLANLKKALQSKQCTSVESALHQAYIVTDESFIREHKGTAMHQFNSAADDEEQNIDDNLLTVTPTSNFLKQAQAVLGIGGGAQQQHSQTIDKDTSGTTAVCCLIEQRTGRLWCANVGDSRALLCHNQLHNQQQQQQSSLTESVSESNGIAAAAASSSGLSSDSAPDVPPANVPAPAPVHQITALTLDHKADRPDEVEVSCESARAEFR